MQSLEEQKSQILEYQQRLKISIGTLLVLGAAFTSMINIPKIGVTLAVVSIGVVLTAIGTALQELSRSANQIESINHSMWCRDMDIPANHRSTD